MCEGRNASRWLWCVALLMLFAPACKRQESKPRIETFLSVGQPAKVSQLTFPALVRSPGKRLLMTAFIHSAFPSATSIHDAIEVLQSNDDGATWTTLGRIASHVTYGVWGYDLAADDQGRIAVCWVAAVYDPDMGRPYKAVMFSSSRDQGLSWSSPVMVSDSLGGQRRNPVLAMKGENLCIAWLDDRRVSEVRPAGIVEDVYFSSSSNGGATWAPNACMETDLDRKTSGSGAPSLCVASDGTVVCAYFSMRNYERRRGGFWIAQSTDRGRTFSSALHDVGPLGDLCLIERDSKLYLAAVYILNIREISMDNPRTAQEIRLYTSSDGGIEWGEHSRIDDDANHGHKNGLRLACPGNGALIACWDDERRGVYMAASVDDGQSWGKNIEIAPPSRVGIAPLDIVSHMDSQTFHVVAGDIVQRGGDAIRLVHGQMTR